MLFRSMLLVRCPQCSASCAVALHARDTITCRHCNHTGPMPEKARAALDESARVLEHTALRDRQLVGVRRVLASGEARSSILYVLVVAVFAAIAVAFALRLTVPWWLGGWRQLVVPLEIIVLFALLGWPGFRAVVRGARSLREACAAIQRPGERAACRACGAPLETSTAIVRCRHCSTDNIVDTKIVQRTEALRSDDIVDARSELEAQVAATQHTRLWSVALVLSFAFYGPVVVAIVHENVIDRIVRPVPIEHRYKVTGTCIHADANGRSLEDALPRNEMSDYVFVSAPLFGDFVRARRWLDLGYRYYTPLDGFCWR